jgi:hypothetical protein
MEVGELNLFPIGNPKPPICPILRGDGRIRPSREAKPSGIRPGPARSRIHWLIIGFIRRARGQRHIFA